MKYAAAPRKEIGVRTIFNILGPLTNPAGAQNYLLGVADGALVEKLAQVLQSLGCDHALVVHGEDGLDEITLTDRSRVCEVKNGTTDSFFISPEDIGMSRVKADDLGGGTAAENAGMLRGVLGGEKGPRRNVVLMNSAAAMVAGNRAESFKEGLKKAEESIDSGAALDKLEKLIDFSRSFTV
jgi:anthranilate phosphoribosyltransferase